ncbi:MAG TPA: transposase [Nitrospirota bacterium]|nr:transposase [Nitrospirota bacterium]
MIVAIQTFGSSDIHWHPHLHCLVTNGCFDKDGTFHPMEIFLPSAIIEVFQHKVFRMLLKEGLITEDRVNLILSWRHTGFHVHNEGRVVANDMEGRERLARYLIRPPVSLERLTYDRENQQVYYQGKAQTHTYHPLDFLAYVSLHIPDKGEQIVRYYGWYSNKSRGLRKKDKPASLTISPRNEDLTHYQKKCRAAWARLIRKIYEVDPLVCPRCLHPMKIVAFIGEDFAIQKILKHLGLWETRTHSPPPSCEYEEIAYVDEPSRAVPV